MKNSLGAVVEENKRELHGCTVGVELLVAHEDDGTIEDGCPAADFTAVWRLDVVGPHRTALVYAQDCMRRQSSADGLLRLLRQRVLQWRRMGRSEHPAA